jgi:two-component system response regulator MprA
MTSALLVEDDERVRRFVIRGLESEGYLVTTAADGPKGLELASRESFDVVILDLMLPGLSGKELCQRLRAADVRVPILMLTALDALENKVEGLRSGADDYLTKPFDFEELLARIEALLRRTRPPEVESLTFADVELNTRTYEVTRAGQPIELTARGFALLEYFMRHPRQVLTREQIFRAVWESDFMGASNVIDVNVSYLRDRLESTGGPRLIQTVRGVGYALREPPP